MLPRPRRQRVLDRPVNDRTKTVLSPRMKVCLLQPTRHRPVLEPTPPTRGYIAGITKRSVKVIHTRMVKEDQTLVGRGQRCYQAEPDTCSTVMLFFCKQPAMFGWDTTSSRYKPPGAGS
jgi:hypothetical protein